MNETFFKVLRCSSLEELYLQLEEAALNGWKPVGNTEIFEGEYVQPINIKVALDDTEEITERISDYSAWSSTLLKPELS